jgi:hypothetical protein
MLEDSDGSARLTFVKRASRSVLALTLVALVACSNQSPGPATPASAPPAPIGAYFITPRVGAPLAPLEPLPAGWAWPFNQAALARGLPAFTIYRPVNVVALQAMRGTSPCAPVEVAPSVWVTPTCARHFISRSSLARPMPFSAPTTSTQPLPASVDLRTFGLDGPVRDQQNAGVCWSFAITGTMDNALRRAGRAEGVAPLHLISRYEWQELEAGHPGRPTVLEPSWPYDPHTACKLDQNPSDRATCAASYGITIGSWRDDPQVAAARSRADATGIYEIVATHGLQSRPGNGDEIASVLVTGQAIYAEIEINMSAWSQHNIGPGGTIADWQPDGTGGHAVTVTGYSTVAGRRYFLVHNSWGTGWAEGGYAWISAEMLRDRLNDAFVITLADARGRVIEPRGGALPWPVEPVPPPPPPPPPVKPADRANGGWGADYHCGNGILMGDSRCGAASRLEWCSLTKTNMAQGGSVSCPYQPGGLVCVAETVGGRSRAACCPPGTTSPNGPGCRPHEVIEPQ